MQAFAYKRHPGFASPLIMRRDQWAGTYLPGPFCVHAYMTYACVRRRDLRLSLSFSRARYLYYYSHERTARIYREAHRPAARTYLITTTARPTSTICLSAVGDRPLPADDHVLSTPRFPNAHTSANVRVIRRLISPVRAISRWPLLSHAVHRVGKYFG